MSNTQLAPYKAGSLDETLQLGQVLAKSGFFSDTREAAQAVVKVMAGAELGFGPIASMTGINIIKGKVALSANLMAAAIKRSGRYNYRVAVLTDKECRIEFSEGGQPCGVSTFTAEDAKKAGLTGDNWSKFPRNMLFARALSNGAKWYCPDLSGGPLYTPDELGAAVDEDGEVIEGTVTPAQQLIPPAPASDADAEFNALTSATEERAPTSASVQQPATNGKRKPLANPAKCPGFAEAVRVFLAKLDGAGVAHEYYLEDQGRVDLNHVLASIAQCGHETITPDNLPQVLADLEARIIGKAKA